LRWLVPGLGAVRLAIGGRLATETAPWTFGPGALMRNLSQRGLLEE
jgi:fumarylacetoacetate (FAA) hydrolase family protein